MTFHILRAGIYEIHQDGKKIADIRRNYVYPRSNTPIRNWHGQEAWVRGYVVTDADGETRFQNLHSIHRKYKFTNFPGFGHILKEKAFR